MIELNHDDEAFALVRAGLLPKPTAGANGVPAWPLDAVAAIVGVDRKTLIDVLVEGRPRFSDPASRSHAEPGIYSSALSESRR
jgi:hypothetical protein